MLSVFDSFCQGVHQERFPQLGGRDDLQQLLAMLTAREACGLIWPEWQRKRGAATVKEKTTF